MSAITDSSFITNKSNIGCNCSIHVTRTNRNLIGSVILGYTRLIVISVVEACYNVNRRRSMLGNNHAGNFQHCHEDDEFNINGEFT